MIPIRTSYLNFTKYSRRFWNTAFTLIEILAVLVVISSLSTVGYISYKNIKENAREEKLRKDVANLNSAISLYLINGGTFNGTETVSQVLRKLKAASANTTSQALSGGYIDNRLTAVMQTAEEAATNELRAIWSPNNDIQRTGFVLVNGGGIGVREFILGQPEIIEPETRSTNFQIATNPGWIWEFSNSSAASQNSGGSEPPSGGGSSPPITASIPSQQLRRLAKPVFSPGGGVYEISIFAQYYNVTLTNPNGRGILHYSLPGQSNSTTATTVTLSLPRGSSYPVSAWVVSDDPVRWLNSEVASETFIIISYLPDAADPQTVGAVVGSGDINGSFVGSLIFSNPTGNLIFNSNGRIMSGNLYLPGTPRIEILPSPHLVVDYGQSFVAGNVTIPRNVIGGKEFSIDGRLISDAPGPQIIDLTGNMTPSNYMLRFNANSYVEGRVYRRANAPTLPNVSVPNLPQRGSVNVGGNTITLQGGDYSEIRMTNRNGVLRLGDPNSAEPIEYVFRDSTFNNGRVEILGPVKIYFTSAFSIKSGFSFGNENRPEDLQIFVTSGELDVQSGGLLSARLVAPNSGVTFRGNFRGTLVACYLNIYGNGVAFTLPPIITQ